MSQDATRKRALASLLALLGQQHGIGDRASGWVSSRLEHALDELAAETGSTEAALDLVRTDRDRLAELAERLRVGETRFYRDPNQWAALSRLAKAAWLGRDRIRGLSVGCSSGQEALTLAMVLDRARQEADRPELALRVTGMDKSETAIATAREGVYPSEALEPLPKSLRAGYFSDSAEGLSVAPHLRAIVNFSVRDALSGPPPGLWELAICKNVLIYMSDDAAERVVSSLLRALSEHGVLLVARSEVARVRALGHRAEELAPGVTVFRAG